MRLKSYPDLHVCYLPGKFTANTGLIGLLVYGTGWKLRVGIYLWTPRSITRFGLLLDRLSSHLTVLPDGLIYHPILSLWYPQIAPGLFGKLKIFTPVVEISGYKVPYSLHSQILIKSKGYHLFNLYGLAILSHRFPRHKIWQDSRINSALTLIIKKKFTSGLSANPYAFPYNPPGFEIGLVVDRFLPGNVAARNLARSMLLAQIKYIQDNQNSPKIDYHTLLARSYELSGLKSSV